jgi:hypothetical protein
MGHRLRTLDHEHLKVFGLAHALDHTWDRELLFLRVAVASVIRFSSVLSLSRAGNANEAANGA